MNRINKYTIYSSSIKHDKKIFDMCKPNDTNPNVPFTYDTPELYNIMTIMWLISLLGRTTLSNLHLDFHRFSISIAYLYVNDFCFNL